MIALSDKLDGRATVVSFWLRGTRRAGSEPAAEIRVVRTKVLRPADRERFEGAYADRRWEWEANGESERVTSGGDEVVRTVDRRVGVRRDRWSFDVVLDDVRTRVLSEHRSWLCDASGWYWIGPGRDVVRVWRHAQGLRMVCADRVFLEHAPAVVVGVASVVLMRWSFSLQPTEG